MLGAVDTIALKAADAIEAEFARVHRGGAVQRKAKVQRHVIDAIGEAFNQTSGRYKRTHTPAPMMAPTERPTKVSPEPTFDRGPCMYEHGIVAADDTCLRCGAGDGEDCRDI